MLWAQKKFQTVRSLLFIGGATQDHSDVHRTGRGVDREIGDRVPLIFINVDGLCRRRSKLKGVTLAVRDREARAGRPVRIALLARFGAHARFSRISLHRPPRCGDPRFPG